MFAEVVGCFDNASSSRLILAIGACAGRNPIAAPAIRWAQDSITHRRRRAHYPIRAEIYGAIEAALRDVTVDQ